MVLFIIFAFNGWYFTLNFIERFASIVIPKMQNFLGPSPWANFDGVHYLSIAEQGYHQYQQAFFPLFPALVHVLSRYVLANYLSAASWIVYTCFFIGLILLWKLVELDFDQTHAKWTIVFLLVFPTSFFFGSIYTESIFLMFILASFYAARKERWFIASLLGMLASATKLVGVFIFPALLLEWWNQNKMKNKGVKLKKSSKSFLWLLFIPVGLGSYMFYLQKAIGDPLAFVHAQPAFGANRTGGEIILLPQVVFRYFNIFRSTSLVEFVARISILEFFMLIFVLGLLVLSWNTIRKSYLLFSFLTIIAPTLTGTLSSMPRYVLVAFPVYIILASLRNNMLKLLLIISFLATLCILVMLFTRGYFIA